MKIVCAAALMLSTTFVFSQNKPVEVCSNKPDSSGLTGCEQAVLENFQLKQNLIQNQFQLLQRQNSELNQQYEKTIEMIKSAHPGTTYSPPDSTHPVGLLTVNSTEKPKEAPIKSAEPKK